MSRTRLIITLLSIAAPLLFLILIIALLFKNADSQIFSNINGGTVESEDYESDDPNVNIFANYPGLYEKVVKIANEVSEEYKLEVDKFLILVLSLLINT